MNVSFLSSKNIGAFYAALSGLFYGLIGYFGLSVINANISIPTMLFWRFLVSSLFILALLLPKLNTIQIRPKEIIKITLSGVALYGSGSMIYFISAQYIGSGLAMVVFYTYPALVMLINFLLYRQAISKIYYLALLVILIGMLCLVNGSPFTFNAIGVALGVIAGLAYALYIIASKNSTVPPLVSTFFISLGSALICLVSALIDKSFTVPLNTEIWFNICGIGIICTALPIVLLLKGLKQISSLQVSILSVLEPVFVVLFGIILLNEKINLTQALGVTILLSGALLTLLNPRFDIKASNNQINLA